MVHPAQMSHPALFRALQSSSLARVGTGGGGESGRARGPPLFEGEVLTRHTEHFSEKYHFADKAKREAGGGNDKDGKGGSDSKKKKSPIHAKGSDADGDGKKNESKKRDRNEDGDDSDSWDDAVRSAAPLCATQRPTAHGTPHHRTATVSRTRWTRTRRSRRATKSSMAQPWQFCVRSYSLTLLQS